MNFTLHWLDSSLYAIVAVIYCVVTVPCLARDGPGAHGRWTAGDGAPAGSGTGSDAGSGADTGTGSCQPVTQAFCAHNWPCFSPVNSSGMSGLISLGCIMSYTVTSYVSAAMLPSSSCCENRKYLFKCSLFYEAYDFFLNLL